MVTGSDDNVMSEILFKHKYGVHLQENLCHFIIQEEYFLQWGGFLEHFL